MENKIKKFIACYFKNPITTYSASLAYYFVFSIFPVLGVLTLLLSSVSNELIDIVDVMPSISSDIMITYLEYTSKSEVTILSTAAIAFFYMPYRAIRFIIWDIRQVYGIKPKMGIIKRGILYLFYTVLFLILLAFTGIMLSVSSEVLRWLIGDTLASYFKLLIPTLSMFVILSYLYRTGSELPFSRIYKGAIIATLGWLIASGIYSFYTEKIGRYSIIYGSLGTIMVFFVWIYLTSFCILLGVRINYALDNNCN